MVQFSQMGDGRFSISAKGYVRENIENHEPSERMIWHQLIRQNFNHSGEAENSELLDTESFLGDMLLSTPRGTDTVPLSSLLQAPPQLIRSFLSASGPRSIGNLEQPNMCCVSCGCVWHRGQFGVGCVSGVILCRYSCRIGDLFVRSCARSLLV